MRQCRKTFYHTSLAFLSLFLLYPSVSFSTNFYFSSSLGDDSRYSIEAKDPETPWKSIAKLNEIFPRLIPGDTVFLKRGDVFVGTIHLKASGSEKKPIVLSAYGTGELPMISGWTTVNDWEGGQSGIYLANPGRNIKPNLLIVDGKPQQMGRYPDQDFISYRKSEASNSLTFDQDLSTLKVEGATLVVRKNQWIIDKHPITAIIDRTIHFSEDSKYEGASGYGFFIQNHPSLLNLFGEWSYRPQFDELALFLGDSSPHQHEIKISTADHLLTNAPNVHSIVVEYLKLSGANKSGINLLDAEDIQVRNSEIEFSGEDAITARNVTKLSFKDNHIVYSQNNGVNLRYGTPRALIRNNVIENTYPFAGMGVMGDGNGIAIYSVSDDGEISNNRVLETGYSGIVFNGDRTSIRNNYIDSFCLIKNDGGGIYTYEGDANKDYNGRRIEGNIIVNGNGSRKGAALPGFLKPQVEGIYIDDNASGIEVINNSIGNVSRNALNIHNARDIIVSDNTMFNGNRQLYISDDERGGPVNNVYITNNIFLAASESQTVIGLSSTMDNIQNMVVFENNLYAYPEGNENVFHIDFRGKDHQINRNSFDFLEWGEKESKNMVMEGFSTSAQVTDKLGATTEIFCLDDDCQLIKEGESVVIETSKPHSSVKINIGSTSVAAQYVLRLQLTNKNPLKVLTQLRHSKAPWSYLSEYSAISLKPGVQTIERIFSYPEDSPNGAVILTFDQPGKFTIDAIDWLGAEILQTKPQIIFRYNPSLRPQQIFLKGDFVDVRNNRVPDTLTLSPFSSKILIRRE